MLCKELSAFSKEFTTCLTTVGVRVTPQFLGMRCGYLITALGSLPGTAFWFCIFTYTVFNWGTDLLGQGSSNCGIWAFGSLAQSGGWELMLTVLRRQRQKKSGSLLSIFHNTLVFWRWHHHLWILHLSPVHVTMWCVFIPDLCWAHAGSCSFFLYLHATRLLSLWLSLSLVKGAVVVLNLLRA